MRATFSRGDIVRVIGLPPSAQSLPGDLTELFAAIVGQELRVDDVDAGTGCLALNVHSDGSQASDWCQHTIWLEPEYASPVSTAAADGRRVASAQSPLSTDLGDASGVVYGTEPALSPEEFIDLLVRSTLAERRPVADATTIAGMLAHATILITARIGGRLVGVSRALSDFSYCTYLSDLAVDVAYQRRGIGRELVRRTHDVAGRHTTLVLLAAPKAREYYPHIGMRRHDSCWVVDRTPESRPSDEAPGDQDVVR